MTAVAKTISPVVVVVICVVLFVVVLISVLVYQTQNNGRCNHGNSGDTIVLFK